MKKYYIISLAFTIIATSSAVITLIPVGMASKTNLAGYYSICSFAPISTIILLALAGTSCKIRSKRLK
jgi:hypothetical protein